MEAILKTDFNFPGQTAKYVEKYVMSMTSKESTL